MRAHLVVILSPTLVDEVDEGRANARYGEIGQ